MEMLRTIEQMCPDTDLCFKLLFKTGHCIQGCYLTFQLRIITCSYSLSLALFSPTTEMTFHNQNSEKNLLQPGF